MRASRGWHFAPGRTAIWAATAVIAATLMALLPSAGAQTSTSQTATTAQAPATAPAAPSPDAFRSPLTAAISSPDQPPELGVANLTVSKVNPDAVTFVVGFDQPFPVPTKDYRVSVYVGDPNMEQTRVSYLAGRAEGLVERGDGTSWQAVGPSPASMTIFGTAEITVPVAGLPPGSAVWVEAANGKGDAAATNLSPYFSYDSLVGKPANGKLESSAWGYVGTPFGRAPGAVPMPDRGVVLSLVNKGLSLTFLDPVPGKALGTEVGAALDYIKIAPGRSETGPRSDYIAIDRTTGAMKLFDASKTPAVDVSDRSNWLIQGFPQGSPGAPATLTFNLEAIAQALGITISDDGVALGVDRAFSLTDGRVLTGVGVIGTVGWFNEATATTAPDPSITAPSSDSATGSTPAGSSRTPLLVGIAAAVGVLVVLALALAVRKRRLRREAEATGEFRWDESPEAPPATSSPVNSPAGSAETPAEPSPEPASEPASEPAPDAEPGSEREPEPEHAAEPEPDAVEGERATSTRKRQSPDDALAALEADLQELTDRLDRLGED